jgi:hypothetical protein
MNIERPLFGFMLVTLMYFVVRLGCFSFILTASELMLANVYFDCTSYRLYSGYLMGKVLIMFLPNPTVGLY